MAAETMAACNVLLTTLHNQHRLHNASVLEVGSGSLSHFVFPSDSTLITLDISHSQLKRNSQKVYPLQGDAHCIPLNIASVDMIVCFNVLEHLNNPGLALEEMYRVLKPNGIFVLGLPDKFSLKGICTRLTPIGFHRWYYRFGAGKKDAGEGHFEAFETTFKRDTEISRIQQWFARKEMPMIFKQAYNGAREYRILNNRPISIVLSIPFYLAGLLGTVLTLGFWRALNSDMLIVGIKKSSGETPTFFS